MNVQCLPIRQSRTYFSVLFDYCYAINIRFKTRVWKTRIFCRKFEAGRLSQDFETLDLEDFRHNFVNITGLRLVDHDNPVIRDTLYQMQLHQHHTSTKLLNNSKELIIKVGVRQRFFPGLGNWLEKLVFRFTPTCVKNIGLPERHRQTWQSVGPDRPCWGEPSRNLKLISRKIIF